jgi:hypothetical protein
MTRDYKAVAVPRVNVVNTGEGVFEKAPRLSTLDTAHLHYAFALLFQNTDETSYSTIIPAQCFMRVRCMLELYVFQGSTTTLL